MAKKVKKSVKEQHTQPLPNKEEKLFNNLLKVTLQLMQGKAYSPLSLIELFERLSLPLQHKQIFHDVLDTLIKQGHIEQFKGNYLLKKSVAPEIETVPGILRVHPRGFGFLQATDSVKFPQDIFIPKHLTQNAVDGDAVEVQVNTDVVSDKGPEGKVIAITERGRSHLAGIIKSVQQYGEIQAYVPLLGPSQLVDVQTSKEFALKVGDRVVMEVIKWGDKVDNTVCRVTHYIGHISDPSVDIKAAVEEFQIRAEFPINAVKEAKDYGTVVTAKEIEQREDLRSIECFTIDPDTAKDFDDALSLSKDSAGHYHLGVHIADVSHYVRPGTALDDEAKLRCNSTYFPGRCIPMLPSDLSDNLCSLKPNVDRLTASVWMQFDPTGDLVTYRISRTVINSAKRFSYREAKDILDLKTESAHLPTLQLMLELCKLLKRKRYERGSIEFSLPDLVVLVDDKGVPQKTDYIPYDETHQLVEEFMLKANEMVATHLNKLGKELVYRVHDTPAEENMKDFSVLTGAFGFHLSEIPTSLELQQLFDEALDSPYGAYLATSYIRRMRLALYSADNIGHYGLGLTHYCHFTSPIRRYVDLVAHRILFGEANEKEALARVGTQCSDQERISAKAENSVVLLKKLRLIKSNYDVEPRKQYQAVVTRVKNFGYFFEILDFMLEGFLHVSELDDDYYIYDEDMMRLRGRHRRETYCSGDRILVMLKSVDFIMLESKWSLIAKEEKNEQEIAFAENRKVANAGREPTPASQFVKERAVKQKEGKWKERSHHETTRRESSHHEDHKKHFGRKDKPRHEHAKPPKEVHDKKPFEGRSHENKSHEKKPFDIKTHFESKRPMEQKAVEQPKRTHLHKSKDHFAGTPLPTKAPRKPEADSGEDKYSAPFFEPAVVKIPKIVKKPAFQQNMIDEKVVKEKIVKQKVATVKVAPVKVAKANASKTTKKALTTENATPIVSGKTAPVVKKTTPKAKVAKIDSTQEKAATKKSPVAHPAMDKPVTRKTPKKDKAEKVSKVSPIKSVAIKKVTAKANTPIKPTAKNTKTKTTQIAAISKPAVKSVAKKTVAEVVPTKNKAITIESKTFPASEKAPISAAQKTMPSSPKAPTRKTATKSNAPMKNATKENVIKAIEPSKKITSKKNAVKATSEPAKKIASKTVPVAAKTPAVKSKVSTAKAIKSTPVIAKKANLITKKTAVKPALKTPISAEVKTPIKTVAKAKKVRTKAEETKSSKVKPSKPTDMSTKVLPVVEKAATKKAVVAKKTESKPKSTKNKKV